VSIQLNSAQADQAEIIQAEYIRNHGLGLDSMGMEGNKGSLAELTLLENGMILGCSKAGGELLGSDPSKITGQPVARLLPQLANTPLVMNEKINPYLRFLTIAGHRYEVKGMNGKRFACELFFSMVEEFGKSCLKITMRPIRQEATLRHLRMY
jgi:hypothetical protein